MDITTLTIIELKAILCDRFIQEKQVANDINILMAELNKRQQSGQPPALPMDNTPASDTTEAV